MTDEQIIKALECCTLTNGNCSQCPLNIEDIADCFKYTIQKHSLDLINRQKAEIERKDRILESYALQYGTVTDKEVFLKQARAEAIREFSKRLKEVDDYVSPLDIDYLVKETTEDK